MAFGGWDHLDPEYRINVKETGQVDPAESLRQVTVSTHWFLAEKDKNVPYELSELRIKLALEEAGIEDYEVVTIEGITRNRKKTVA
ncbi:hypothetical protein AB9P05_16305 [Roseivirga sp. BDSF3-8]|uniref:hypothetical protein n=1 Tax=Roseivirga sp. BDSF3-8 TaxID=3241598 RepID=UPI003531B888